MKFLTTKTIFLELFFLKGPVFVTLCSAFYKQIQCVLGVLLVFEVVDWLFTFYVYSSRWDKNTKAFFRMGFPALVFMLMCMLPIVVFNLLLLYLSLIYAFARYCISYVVLDRNNIR